MNPANQEALSVLAIDIGTINTHALLFEIVDESYFLIGAGTTPTTTNLPVKDVLPGVIGAIHQLQELTGRILLNPKDDLIIPSQVDGVGIDRLYITFSIGKKLKLVTFGLMDDVSVQSVKKLAATVPGETVESISLNDPRTIHQQIDDVIRSRPDLILFAGGTDRGSTRAVKKMADLLVAILQVIPKPQRPPVVFCGNQSLVKPIKNMLEAYTQFESTSNIRPEMDNEELDQASEDVARVITTIQASEVEGFQKLIRLCNDSPCPTTIAIGRITRFLSKVGDPEKGVLSIDLGASATITASAVAGKLDLNILPVGSGEGLAEFLRVMPFSEITRWFPAEIDLEEARDQIWQKTLFPASIPMTLEALTIEQAVYRQMLHYIMYELSTRGVLAPNGYETILCSGMALTQGSNPNQLLMMLLDGLQPRGISTLILDSHSILSTLGAISRTLPLLPVQVLESSAFANLATVVSPVSSLRAGAVVLRGSLEYSNQKIRTFEVKQGGFTVLPLRAGDTATLELVLSHNVQVESTELAETRFKVNGSVCGVVIDARGRPIRLPKKPEIRAELFSRWNGMLAQK
jgi:hypothetical protein